MTAKQLTGSFAPDGSQYVTLTDGAGNLVAAGGGTAANINTTTTVTPTSGTQGVLFNNAGVLGSDSGFTYAGASGEVDIAGVLALPTTTSATVGVINFGSNRFLHDFGSTSNVFLGTTAGNFTLTGTHVTAVGISAGAALTSASDCTLIGRLAGTGVTSGAGNTALGSNCLGGAIGINTNNTAVGNACLNVCVSSNNTGVGQGALSSLTSGASNTAIGQGTGVGITTGGNNTILGAGVTGLSAGLAGAIILAIGTGAIKADFGNTNAVTWTFAGPVRPQTYTVATLPAAPGTGAIAVVTDQLTTPAAKGSAPTGGGAVVCTVMFTGAGWVGI